MSVEAIDLYYGGVWLWGDLIGEMPNSFDAPSPTNVSVLKYHSPFFHPCTFLGLGEGWGRDTSILLGTRHTLCLRAMVSTWLMGMVYTRTQDPLLCPLHMDTKSQINPHPTETPGSL